MRFANDADLLDAALKLIRLLDTPDEIKFLSPALITREIDLSAFEGKTGCAMSHLLVSEGDTRPHFQSSQEQLRENLDQQRS